MRVRARKPGHSERFVTRPRRIAAFPTADHVVVRAKALHGVKAPVDGAVVVFRRFIVRSLRVNIHSLAPEMTAGRDLGIDRRGEIVGFGVGHGYSG